MIEKFILHGDHDHDCFTTSDEMSKKHWSVLMACHHSGACDNEVNVATEYFDINNYELAFDYLVSAGIDKDALGSHDKVLEYYLWIIASDIQENAE